MHDQDEEESIEDGILEDVGRWRRDQDRIDAYGTPAEVDDGVERLTDAQREEIIARLSGRRLSAVPEPGDDEGTVETTGAQDASSRTMLSLPRRPPPLGWRMVASHGLAAAVAAGIMFAVMPRSDVGASGVDDAPRFERARVLGTSAASHLGDDDESCLDEPAQVRIEPSPGASVSPDVPLEVWIHAKPPSGSPHWMVHRLGSPDSPWTRSSDGSLFFAAPLSNLAPLSPGDWTLDFHVGPRGACGPDALPSCRALPTVVVRVASAAACHAAR